VVGHYDRRPYVDYKPRLPAYDDRDRGTRFGSNYGRDPFQDRYIPPRVDDGEINFRPYLFLIDPLFIFKKFLSSFKFPSLIRRKYLKYLSLFIS
jgi:hypothetical protein